MSEATYTGGDDPEKPQDEGEGASGGTGGRSGVELGSVTIDTTYPRSIEGILKLVTVVSQSTSYK